MNYSMSIYHRIVKAITLSRNNEMKRNTKTTKQLILCYIIIYMAAHDTMNKKQFF